MKRSPKLPASVSECACGCCTAVCPWDALYIASGVTARLDEDKCVGCGNVQKSVRQTLFPSSNGGLRCKTENGIATSGSSNSFIFCLESVQHPVRLAGHVVLYDPAPDRSFLARGRPIANQALCGARTAAGTVGRKTEAFPERSSAEVFAGSRWFRYGFGFFL